MGSASSERYSCPCIISPILISTKNLHLQKFRRGRPIYTQFPIDRGSAPTELRAPETIICPGDTVKLHKLYISPSSGRVRLRDARPDVGLTSTEHTLGLASGEMVPHSSNPPNIGSRILQVFSSVVQRGFSIPAAAPDNAATNVTALEPYKIPAEVGSTDAQHMLTVSQRVPATPGKKRFVSDYFEIC
jgi:hypothetical protein